MLLFFGGLLCIPQVLGRFSKSDVRQFFLGRQFTFLFSICHEGVPNPPAEGGYLRAQAYPREP